jgi:hypothetical protein
VQSSFAFGKDEEMSRYTEAQLIELIGRVNDITSSPDYMMPLVGVFAIGHYYLKRGRDGYMLARIMSEDGECCDVFGQGWMTKPELGARLDAYVKGLEEARRCVVKHSRAMAWA